MTWINTNLQHTTADDFAADKMEEEVLVAFPSLDLETYTAAPSVLVHAAKFAAFWLGSESRDSYKLAVDEVAAEHLGAAEIAQVIVELESV